MGDTAKLIGLTVAIIGSTFGAIGWFSGNVEKAIASHGEHPHKPTAIMLEKLAVEDSAQNRQIAKLEHLPEDIGAIRARIDLIIEADLDHARTSAPLMRRMRRAASKVRAASPPQDDDPLAGLEGLQP